MDHGRYYPTKDNKLPLKGAWTGSRDLLYKIFEPLTVSGMGEA